jgi:hypothetical protein
MPSDLSVVDGAEAGAWIAPRLEGGFGGKVKQLMPNGYDACVRIFHAALDREGKQATWASVAAALGRTAHREMQWHKLVGSSDTFGTVNSEWPGEVPSTGELDPPQLEALCGILARHTADPEQCFFGLSTIYGSVEDSYPDAVLLRWPDRDFVVFSGPLSAADQVGYELIGATVAIFSLGARPGASFDLDRWQSQAPNMIWPADRSWFVVSEYDLDSTLVGGGRALVDAILAAPELETLEVERGDSLQDDADEIN